MDTDGARELLAAVIEQAVVDWRWAAANNMIDKNGRPTTAHQEHTKNKDYSQYGQASSLDSFFFGGGIGVVSNNGNININAALVRSQLRRDFSEIREQNQQ